ncbi:MAG: beta-galactosidase [Anaerolineae bacterium]|nr:beta-galactosidase [Anaerolineae bacterium]
MTTSATVQVTPDGLLIGGELMPLYSGSVHYWRHERKDWDNVLANVRQMGYRFLDTYFPWTVHEIERGRFDFGEIDPRKDVAAFLEACRNAGLYVLARPGPHINAELPTIGFPPRVLDNPAVQSLTATGAPAVIPVVNTPFIAPSYASEAFYEEVGVYFDALAPILKEHLYPAGMIVAVQADNEMSFCFRMRCYDLDYNADAVALYQRWLAEKYSDLAELNRAYGTSYATFAEIDAPREFNASRRADLPYYLDWAEFQEYYIHYGLNRVRVMLQERGLTGVPYYHNYPTFYPEAPFRMAALEKDFDIAGVDAYPRVSQYPAVKRGSQFTSTMSRLPFIPEFGSGVWAWYRPLSVEDQRFNMRATFMHGIRAINYYMLADRDRWLNCPLLNDGTPRPDHFAVHQTWNEQLQRLRWHKLRPQRDVLILTPRIYEQLRYVAIDAGIPYDWIFSFYVPLPNDLFASEQTFGGRDLIQLQLPAWITALRQALETLGVPYALGDSDIPLTKLQDYAAVVVPTFEWIDAALLDKLDRYAQAGGHVICGPRLPAQDVYGQPLNHWNMPAAEVSGQRIQLGADLWLNDADLWQHSSDQTALAPFATQIQRDQGDVTLITGALPTVGEVEATAYSHYAAVLLPILQQLGIVQRWHSDNPALDVTVFEGEGRRVVCVANATATIQQGEISVPEAATWRDIDTQQQSSGTLKVKMDAWAIKIWEISA